MGEAWKASGAAALEILVSDVGDDVALRAAALSWNVNLLDLGPIEPP